MSITLDTDRPAGFDHELYERTCPRPYCSHMVVFHFARIHDGTHGTELHTDAHSVDIVTKCHACGHLDYAQPPITKEQYDRLEALWGGDLFMPWSENIGDGTDEIDDVYTKSEAKRIRERLDDLGYI